MTTQAPLIKWTERDMLDLLRRRYGPMVGNGPRYAVAEHVRSGAGFDAKRTADFIAMDVWPSQGLALHGHEVKVSRSDWLTELKQSEKAEAFRPFMDYWWLVVSDPSIVRGDDLPPGWGLLTPGRPAVSSYPGEPVSRPGTLRMVKRAKKIEAQPLPKTMLAALLRAVAKTAARGVR